MKTPSETIARFETSAHEIASMYDPARAFPKIALHPSNTTSNRLFLLASGILHSLLTGV